jgi:hypothetical protein
MRCGDERQVRDIKPGDFTTQRWGRVAGDRRNVRSGPLHRDGQLHRAHRTAARAQWVQPALNLVYSTGHGNGPFGLGWSLSIPGVSRQTSKGVPRYRDHAVDPQERATFILSGAEDLVPVEASMGRYRPRTEGLFARIIHHHDEHLNSWEVGSKDGLVSFYGSTRAADGTDPAVVTDPADRTKIFAWHLVQTVDPFANRIVYEYQRDTGEAGPHRWDQLYLHRIRYVDYTVEGTGEERFLVSVTFEYGDPGEEHPDPFSEYRAGFEIRTRKRCQQIVVLYTHADQDRRVRSYKLIYLDEQVAGGERPETVLPRNGVSLLSQIRVIGHDHAQPFLILLLGLADLLIGQFD